MGGAQLAEVAQTIFYPAGVAFPFTVIREEDMDLDPFSEEEESKPFAIDSEMTVLEFGYNEFHEAVMAHVKQGKSEGWVPLADLATPVGKSRPKAIPIIGGAGVCGLVC
jgi:hypothetical protein